MKTAGFLYAYLVFWLPALSSTHGMLDGNLQAPSFIHEPPSKLLFSNDSGSQVSCSAMGNPPPTLEWVLKDGSIVTAVPGLRQTPGNGSLYFPPFTNEYFRSNIHERIYRCKASNLGGTILSRDVDIRAVVRKDYEVQVEGRDVILGNVAILRCHVPEYVRSYVHVISWSRDDETFMTGLSDMTGRYLVMAGIGDLHIRTVRADDNLKKFSCSTLNTINGERRESDAVYLSIKDVTTNMAPRTNQKPIIDVSIDRGNDIYLPCNIQGNPLPIFTWYRVTDSGSLYPVSSSIRIILSQTLLIIKNTDERDSGKWVCKATNQYGDLKLEINLIVNVYLAAHIYPQFQMVNSGGSIVFNCSISDPKANSIDWYHNGALLIGDNKNPGTNLIENRIKLLTRTSLLISNVKRSDKGIYQCLVNNGKMSAQAMAELRLGEIVPELLYTFIEQSIQPGQMISLKCSGTGTPPPQFTWLVDSQPIMDISSSPRYEISQYVDSIGNVISHLNISHVRSDDGGLYKCVASNTMGTVEHTARLNVYGPPYVRAIGPIKTVAGHDLVLHCPFSGYPIDSFRWEKSRIEINSGAKYEIANVMDGGHLKIRNVVSDQDSGIYTCIVRGRTGEEARRDIQLIVNSPPVIEPFSFPKNLQEGGRAQVSCSVTSGDMPVYFSWMKDNAPIPLSLQITEKKEEFYTLLVFKDISSRHSGQYTCFASNSAAKVNYTAEMLIRVAPKWIQEPKDMAVMLGNPLMMQCEADGYPIPKITWLRGQGKSSKEFKSIQLKNSTLYVDLATEDDEGYYMCQANNGIGVGLKKIIYINVNEPVRFDYPVRNVSAKRNDPVTLTCQARGDEPIKITWTRNGVPIEIHNYRISVNTVNMDDGLQSVLSISRTDRYDSGVYKCMGQNAFGSSEHIVYLAVQEPPDVPSNLKAIEIWSRSVKLSWRRPFDGNSPVLSYIVQYHPKGSFNVNIKQWDTPDTVNISLPMISGSRGADGDIQEQATVAGLLPATTYVIRMLAINEIEKSEFTDPIVFKTQEEAPTQSPQNVQVLIEKPNQLIVTWKSPPKDSWNGEIREYTVSYMEEPQRNGTTIGKNSLTVDGWATTKATIVNLKTYTRYGVSVRAVNGFAPGPWSPTVYATTLEGIPTAAPLGLNCSSLSSQSIKIWWNEPPVHHRGGIILGYKLYYRPLVKQMDLTSTNEIKRTSNMETYLHALYKATNYTIKVLAFTSAGDGIPSIPVYCTTDDDVPEPPANIKVVTLTADSILVSWLPPRHRNGIITHYTVYSKEVGRKGQPKSNIIRVDEYGYPVTYQARGLIENQKYEFWVSASTSMGEGEPTAVVTQTATTRAPARIGSFSQAIRKAVGTSLLLECLAVGNPTPRALWYTKGRAITFSQFYKVTDDGNLKIHKVEYSLSGNYTCTAKNIYGNDSIEYQLIAMKPPSSPTIIVQYASADSIRLSWDKIDDGGAPIQGFVISYQPKNSKWLTVDVTPELKSFLLTDLKCGTQYAIKISAYNGIGTSRPSDEVLVWTKGKTSSAPVKEDFIKTNSSCIDLNLGTWNDGGCTITHFSVKYRTLGEINWTIISSDLANNRDNKETLVFCNLKSATWYEIHVIALSDAGNTSMVYNAATTTIDGFEISTPPVFLTNDSDNEVVATYAQTEWISGFSICLIVIIILLLICLIFKYGGLFMNRNDSYESRAISTDLKSQLDQRREQPVYTASPVKMLDKNVDSEMYEISPYATFSVAAGRQTNATNKTPIRNNPSLDYTMQFKTFGHPDLDDLNATAYPMLPNQSYGHKKGKSWHKQRYYNTDDESTLSKSMTIMAGGSQTYRNTPARESGKSRGKSRSDINVHPHGETESDTSGSPTLDFSNAPTYRVPVKSSREMFRPDSSTESYNDNSPVDRRVNTPRHQDLSRRQHHGVKHIRSDACLIDPNRPTSSNSTESEGNIESGLRFCPPNGFTDSIELSEAECDRERDLDLEVQRVMANINEQISAEQQDEVTSLLVRYKERKDRDRREHTIHV